MLYAPLGIDTQKNVTALITEKNGFDYSEENNSCFVKIKNKYERGVA